jgi:hypothetical protein
MPNGAQGGSDLHRCYCELRVRFKTVLTNIFTRVSAERLLLRILN